MASKEAYIRVLRIRSDKTKVPTCYGGTVFVGYEVDENGNKLNAYEDMVVYGDSKVIPHRVYPGEVWNVKGELCNYTYQDWKGCKATEQQVKAVVAYRAKIAGDNFVDYVGANEVFVGISKAKAQRVWDKYHEEVYEILDNDNGSYTKQEQVEAIASVQYMTSETATILVEQWKLHGFSDALEWLDRMHVPSRLAQSIIKYYGDKAKQVISENPYSMIKWSADWYKVDAVAREYMGINKDDPRRLAGAILMSLVNSFTKEKNTGLSERELMSRVRRLLGDDLSLAKKALGMKHDSDSYVKYNGLYQHAGAHGMEASVAKQIIERMKHHDPGKGIRVDDVYKSIERYEMLNRKDLPNGLMGAQKKAVIYAVYSPIIAVSGGAGTGKTTVLKAINFVLEEVAGVDKVQMALAGKAAGQIRTATNGEASTIHSFLKKYESDTEEPLPEDSYLVVDEASMVDIILAWRIFNVLPATGRLILVGDHEQLSPVGPGLFFRKLIETDCVEVVELTVAKRFAEDSGIHPVSNSVRQKRWPDIPRYTGISKGVSFLECPKEDIADNVLRVYVELGGDKYDVRILGSVKNGVVQGTEHLNRLVHDKYRSDDEPVVYYDEDFEAQAYTRKKFCVNDQVIWVRNNYSKGLMNGDLGVIKEVLNEEGSEAICTAEFNGALHDLTLEDAMDMLHAYAITTHKAQGSAFKRVIVPVAHNRVLDRHLIYTALTRAIEQVVFVGIESNAMNAIGISKAEKRSVAFGVMLKEFMQQEQDMLMEA